MRTPADNEPPAERQRRFAWDDDGVRFLVVPEDLQARVLERRKRRGAE